MDNDTILNSYGTQEVKLIDRSIVTLSGISRIISFDDEEFVMESNMGMINLKGEKLELVKLDTHDGHVKIKGKINNIIYMDNIKVKKEESLLSKLFK